MFANVIVEIGAKSIDKYFFIKNTFSVYYGDAKSPHRGFCVPVMNIDQSFPFEPRTSTILCLTISLTAVLAAPR